MHESLDLSNGCNGANAQAAVSLPISVRASAQTYLIVILAGTFLSSFLFYLEVDIPALLVFAFSWTVVPLLAVRDRVEFDGERLRRTGLSQRVFSAVWGTRASLRVSDIEQVRSHVSRTMRRGLNVSYKYQTVFAGRGLAVSIVSGGEHYIGMLRAIASRVHQDVLDNRSLELAEFLIDAPAARALAVSEDIPASDVAENSLRAELLNRRRDRSAAQDANRLQAQKLQHLGNRLRIAGLLPQSLEAFRRALVTAPGDPSILFDTARCLYAIGSIERDQVLGRKAVALARLSALQNGRDETLLYRLSEWYADIGEWRLASTLLRRLKETFGESFSSERLLSETALQEGKMAYVVHHLSAAVRLASTPALRRWARTEQAYFAGLQADDDYLATELSRVSLLNTFDRVHRSTAKLAIAGIPAVVLGVVFAQQLVAQVGWAISGISFAVSLGSAVLARLLDKRMPYEAASDE